MDKVLHSGPVLMAKPAGHGFYFAASAVPADYVDGIKIVVYSGKDNC